MTFIEYIKGSFWPIFRIFTGFQSQTETLKNGKKLTFQISKTQIKDDQSYGPTCLKGNVSHEKSIFWHRSKNFPNFQSDDTDTDKFRYGKIDNIQNRISMDPLRFFADLQWSSSVSTQCCKRTTMDSIQTINGRYQIAME